MRVDTAQIKAVNYENGSVYLARQPAMYINMIMQYIPEQKSA